MIPAFAQLIVILHEQLEQLGHLEWLSQIATQKPEKETRQMSAFYVEQLEKHPNITVDDDNAKTWSQLSRFYQGIKYKKKRKSWTDMF